jgi:glycosyltransferase involved in cell wall biosynthesis
VARRARHDARFREARARMRILVVSPMPPQPRGAGAIPVVLHAQVSGLARRHDVTVATVAGPDAGELAAVERLPREGIETHYVLRVLPRGIRRWRRGRLAGAWLRGRLPWRTIWFAEPALQQVIDRLLADDRFDIVTVQDNAMALYRFDTAAPRVLNEYEVRRPRCWSWRWGTLRQWPRSAFREADWARWPVYQRTAWQRFDALNVFSARDAGAVREQAPELADRLHIVPFGVELPPVANDQSTESVTIMFVGNFTHPPNVDAALYLGRELMPRIRQRVDGARLQLVGPLPPTSVRALDGDEIEVIGEVPDVDEYLRRATLVMAPVRIGGGMRMKIVQAMAFGKAVVTTPRGLDGLEIDGDAPPVAVAAGTDATVAAVTTLLSDVDRRKDLGRRARRFAERHLSADAYARRLEGVYADALERKGSVPL